MFLTKTLELLENWAARTVFVSIDGISLREFLRLASCWYFKIYIRILKEIGTFFGNGGDVKLS